MAKVPWVSALFVIGIVALCAWAYVQTDVPPPSAGPGPLERLAASKAQDQGLAEDRSLVKELEDRCVRGSLRPGLYPEWPTVRDELGALYQSRKAPGDMSRSTVYRVLLIAAGAAGLVALIAAVRIRSAFRQLSRADTKAGRELTSDRRHAIPAAVGLLVAGCVAAGFGALALIRDVQPAFSVILAGELHGLVGVLMLPVGAWLVSFSVLCRVKRAWLRVIVLPLSVLAAGALMAGWGAAAGAWHLQWSGTALIVWLGLSYAITPSLLDKADRVVMQWSVPPSGASGGGTLAPPAEPRVDTGGDHEEPVKL